MKLGSHLNLLGTIGTASILLWGLSQSRAKPEYSPAYIQVQTVQRPSRKVAVRLAPKLKKAPGTTRRAVKVAAIDSLRAMRKLAAIENLHAAHNLAAKGPKTIEPKEFEPKEIEPKAPVYQLASQESGDGSGASTAANKTPIVRSIVDRALPKQIKDTRRLIGDVTIKNLCKLRKYAALEPTAPVNQPTSNEGGDGMDGPAKVEVTPFIQKIMNTVRPKQITGTMTVEGKEYAFGSGGHGQSIPYGDYLITPDAIGSWGSRHGAIGVANGTIPDPKLHRDRDGIELHAATNDKLETDGCVSIKKDQWPQFRKQVLGMVKDNKKVYLHVSNQGASVSTTPLEFIGETISEPIFRDVLSTIENPPSKVENDRPAARRSARSRFRGERHASCGHDCRRRHGGSTRLRS